MLIEICVGSSCFIKGSSEVVRVFQDQVQTHQLGHKVEMRGSFCLGHCMNGVCMRIDGRYIDHVYPDCAVEVFEKEVLEVLK
ncbi:MAG: (2Fe-2S) ferredoxin domain-containing protein [Erysipelotrichaceae bacterium]